MAQREQTLKNHTRYMPWHHFFVVPVLLVNVVAQGFQLNQNRTPYQLLMVLVAVALFVFTFTARAMALKAQDRIIRLEERMRLATLLPESDRASIASLTPGQLVAIRFAADDEVPYLVRGCVTGDLKTAADVKKSVRTWRPDYLRV